MDDFTKTKIAYTVALLATVYTIKPIVDAFKDIGFKILNFDITLQIAFFGIVAFLGIATYLMSLQFLSQKEIRILSKLSHYAYALSLTIPILFCLLWLFVSLIEQISPHLNGLIEITIRILVPVISFILGASIASYIKHKIEIKELQQKNELVKNNEISYFLRAKKLFEENQYDLSLLESYKIVELSLRQFLENISYKNKDLPFFKIIKEAYKFNIITNMELQQLNELRILRNKTAHTSTKITRTEAQRGLNLAERFISKLSVATSVSSFNWLLQNYDAALRALIKVEDPMQKEVIEKLWDAWKNRDGAIAAEISGLFSAALEHNPSIVIDMFKRDEKEFGNWLKQINIQIFSGDDISEVENIRALKTRIMASLQRYYEDSKSKKEKAMALLLRRKIHEGSINIIDVGDV